MKHFKLNNEKLNIISQHIILKYNELYNEYEKLKEYNPDNFNELNYILGQLTELISINNKIVKLDKGDYYE